MKQLEINSVKHGKYYVLLDDEDYDEVAKYNWCLQRAKYGFYAAKYFRSPVDNREIYVFMHRFIMKVNPGQVIDHLNGNGLDNQKHNLRICTITQNNRNSKKRKHGKATFKGVEINNKRFSARITIDKKRIWLGSFSNENEAAIAYNEAAKKYHGEFAKLNDI